MITGIKVARKEKKTTSESGGKEFGADVERYGASFWSVITYSFSYQLLVPSVETLQVRSLK